MILILFMIPFLTLLFTALVLSYTGRNFKEKLTIFLCNPEDTGKGSSGLITVLRIGFWLSLFLSVLVIISIIRHKG